MCTRHKRRCALLHCRFRQVGSKDGNEGEVHCYEIMESKSSRVIHLEQPARRPCRATRDSRLPSLRPQTEGKRKLRTQLQTEAIGTPSELAGVQAHGTSDVVTGTVAGGAREEELALSLPPLDDDSESSSLS